MEFYSHTISGGWEQSIRYLLANGDYVNSQRGMRTIEITNAVFHVSNPLMEPIVSPKYHFGNTFIENFVQGIEENYPHMSISKRIYKYGDEDVNQLQRVVDLLKEDYFSRRAIINLWLPKQDFSSLHPPCPVIFQFYIRNNSLGMTAILRSNDAWMAAIPDMVAFSRLQQKVSELIGIKMGSYTQVSVSYHIYEKDLVAAREIFAN